MRRAAQFILLGSVALAAALQLEDTPGRVAGPEGVRPEATEVAAPAPLRASEVRSFLTRSRIPYRQAEVQRLTDRVNQAAARYGLDPALVLAVIRVESTFRAGAISPKGAVGLMQLLPTTAAEMAAEMGVQFEGEHQLLDPDLNIELGARYLRKLLDRFGGDRRAALEAYYQGPNRLAAELLRSPELEYRYASRVIPHWQSLR